MSGIGSQVYPTAPARSRAGRSTGPTILWSYLNAVLMQGGYFRGYRSAACTGNWVHGTRDLSLAE